MGLTGVTLDIEKLTAVSGVKRISLGSAFLRAALEVRDGACQPEAFTPMAFEKSQLDLRKFARYGS